MDIFEKTVKKDEKLEKIKILVIIIYSIISIYMIHKDIHNFQHNLIDWITYITYFLYFVIAFGLSSSAPEYLDTLSYYTKIYVGLFLVYRFNPFRHVKMTKLDVKIAFNAGVFLLASTSLTGILRAYMDQIKQFTKTY